MMMKIVGQRIDLLLGFLGLQDLQGGHLSGQQMQQSKNGIDTISRAPPIAKKIKYVQTLAWPLRLLKASLKSESKANLTASFLSYITATHLSWALGEWDQQNADTCLSLCLRKYFLANPNSAPQQWRYVLDW